MITCLPSRCRFIVTVELRAQVENVKCTLNVNFKSNVNIKLKLNLGELHVENPLQESYSVEIKFNFMLKMLVHLPATGRDGRRRRWISGSENTAPTKACGASVGASPLPVFVFFAQ